MGIYSERDAKTGITGDFVISENGDIDIADSPTSTRQLLKTIINTDKKDLEMIESFGANLGSLIGTPMEEALERIPILIRDGLRKANYIDLTDIIVDVYPIDFDKIIIFIDLGGTYINNLGQEVSNRESALKFLFSYSNNRIVEWNND